MQPATNFSFSENASENSLREEEILVKIGSNSKDSISLSSLLDDQINEKGPNNDT
jgi:hypothetical protein